MTVPKTQCLYCARSFDPYKSVHTSFCGRKCWDDYDQASATRNKPVKVKVVRDDDTAPVLDAAKRAKDQVDRWPIRGEDDWPKGSLQWAVKSGQRFRRHRMKTYLYIDSNGNIKDYDGDYVVLSRSDIVTLDWEVEHDG